MDVNTKTETIRLGGAAAAVTVYGITLNEWVAIATLIYLSFQIVALAPKTFTTIYGWIVCLRSKLRRGKS